jgi:hypothetical protein
MQEFHEFAFKEVGVFRGGLVAAAVDGVADAFAGPGSGSHGDLRPLAAEMVKVVCRRVVQLVDIGVQVLLAFERHELPPSQLQEQFHVVVNQLTKVRALSLAQEQGAVCG